jgi:hypothetical protein
MSWHDRAKMIIGKLCEESYKISQTSKNGERFKTHHPYSVPETAQRLIKALDEDDEETAKAIMLYDYHADRVTRT